MGGYTCCVPGCYNNSIRSTDKKFHRFPQNVPLRRKWTQLINRKAENGKLFQPDSRSHRVCSAHIVNGMKTNENNIPTVFPTKRLLTTSKPRMTNSAARAAEPVFIPPNPASPELSLEEQQHVDLVGLGIQTPMYGAEVEIGSFGLPPVPTLGIDDTPMPIPLPPSSKDSYCSSAKQLPTPSKKKLQNTVRLAARDLFTTFKTVSASKAEITRLKSMVLDIDSVLKCKDTLNLYTGFKNKQYFLCLIESLRPDFQIIQFPGGKKSKLSPPNWILLTLVKYKLDTPQEDLAFR